MALLSHFLLKVRIIINPRLIIEIPNDLDSKKRYFLDGIGRNNIWRSFLNPRKLFLVLVVLLLPISASAGLVGMLSGIFLKDIGAENLLSNKNIQNMSLLVAVSTPLNNQISPAPIVDGNALVSNTGPSGAALDFLANKPTSDQISIYMVREGDTLSQIAEMFDVTVNTIKWGNDLSSNTLKVGDTLVILPISGVKHTVIKGDTVASIAKKLKAVFASNITALNKSKTEEISRAKRYGSAKNPRSEFFLLKKSDLYFIKLKILPLYHLSLCLKSFFHVSGMSVKAFASKHTSIL